MNQNIADVSSEANPATGHASQPADQPQPKSGPMPDATQNPTTSSKRKHMFSALAITCLVGAIAATAYYYLYLQFDESTDDAYVAGNLVQINSQIPGTVVAINADDTQLVSSGVNVIRLDPADTLLTLAKSEAALAQTVQQVSAMYVNSDVLKSQVVQRQAELSRAQDDLQRRLSADQTGAVSAEDIGHARDSIKERTAALQTARQQLAANRAQTGKSAVAEHPDVLVVASKVREDYLAYERNAVPAPVTGYIAKRSVQLGQRVTPGTPLMAIVPLDGVWVDANFKEGELKNIRIGQPVTLNADVYGKHVPYHGTVIGFSAGTGSAFSVLPAQNATGNWIKVVQRLPVRIQLNAIELRNHPLRIGMSMQVDVDTHDRAGSGLAVSNQSSFQTHVFDNYSKQAEVEINRIINKNVATN